VRISPKDMETLLSRLRIEDVVGEFVHLEKRGSGYRGLCPFHNDTNPSFSVDPKRNICHCFSCGAGGNPVSFYAKYKQIPFPEAAKALADKFGIPIRITGEDVQKQERYEKYYRIMEEAHRFFQDKIFETAGTPALEYLSRRDLKPDVIKAQKLGYATTKWSELNDHLIQKGFAQEDFAELGLVKVGEKGSYDFFRGRIMFPIYNASGRLIAFGGRTIESGEDIPKYMNSLENPIFHKGRTLYGLERGNAIKKRNYAILMEGYMDVLSAVLYGFDTAVAPLGTALTDEQCRLLKNYTTNVLLSFDSDAAGQDNSVRSGLLLKNHGFTVRVVCFSGAKDPDEFLKRFGKDAYLSAIENSKELFDFLYAYTSGNFDLQEVAGKLKFVRSFREFFACVHDGLEKSLYIEKLGKAVGIETEILKKELIVDNAARPVSAAPAETRRILAPAGEKDVITDLERQTLVDILADPDNFKYYRFQEIRGSLTKKIFHLFEEMESGDPIKQCMDLRDTDGITPAEEAALDHLICVAVGAGVDDKEKKETRTADIIKGWFSADIRDKKKNIKGFMDKFELVKLEDRMKNCTVLEDVLRIYGEYEEFAFHIS